MFKVGNYVIFKKRPTIIDCNNPYDYVKEHITLNKKYKVVGHLADPENRFLLTEDGGNIYYVWNNLVERAPIFKNTPEDL